MAKLGITFRVSYIEPNASLLSVPDVSISVELGLPLDLGFCNYSDSDYAGDVETC